LTEYPKKNDKTPFRFRIFVSFGVFLSFLSATTSGILLFLRPEGSLASWTGWNALGIDKKGWEGVHILSIIMFLCFAAFHVCFNWKVLVGYIRRKTTEGKRLRKERIAALIVVSLVLAGAVARFRPFWKAIEFRAEFKKGAFSMKVPPPATDAEQLSLADLCALAGIQVEDALARLDRAGCKIDGPRTTLSALAKKHRTTPEKLYLIILGR
jgi:hypothetical protein